MCHRLCRGLTEFDACSYVQSVHSSYFSPHLLRHKIISSGHRLLVQWKALTLYERWFGRMASPSRGTVMSVMSVMSISPRDARALPYTNINIKINILLIFFAIVSSSLRCTADLSCIIQNKRHRFATPQ